jgi:FkbM family methyltransferase
MDRPQRPRFRGFGLGLVRRLRRAPPPEAELVIRECRRLAAGAAFWDIGANVGDVSAAMLGHAASILAVEPDADVFAALSARLEGRATCVRALVGPEGEARTFLRSAGSSASSTSVRPGDEPPHPSLTPELMRAVSLDRLARDHGFPDVLKIDVEGYEIAVLDSGPEVLARRPRVILEFNAVCLSNFGRVNPRDAIERLLAIFPRLERITPGGREPVTDPVVFVHDNMLKRGALDNLVGGWG